MRRVLVAIDGSESSLHAARLGVDLAARYGARVTLAYVVPRLLLPPDVYGLTAEEVDREQGGHAREVLRAALVALSGPGVEIDMQVLHGPPAEAVAEAAHAPDVDLLVVGSRGQGAVKRVLMGSVSDRLVHICPKPVLVVR